MPPLDDPIPRLVGRAAFYDALVSYCNSCPSAKPFTSNPLLEDEEVDLYFLFEVFRALGGAEAAANKRQLVVIRNMMLFTTKSTLYSLNLRSYHTRHCLPCETLLTHAVDTAYRKCHMYTTSYSWVKSRTEYFKTNRMHALSSTDDPSSRYPAAAHRPRYVSPPDNDSSVRDDLASFVKIPEATRAAYRALKNPYVIDNDEIHHYLFEGNSSRLVLLDLRNHIIRMWYRNTRKRLSLQEALQEVPFRYHQLGVRVYTHLLCTGTINFGAIPISNVISQTLRKQPSERPHVAVIGAGISGLIAARQLMSLGVDVTIYEARSRAGGRIWTEEQVFSTGVDMGAMLITGLINNPAATLAHQTNAELHVVDTQCPIFDVDGKWVSKEKDVHAFRFFNSCLDEAHEMRGRISEGKALTMSLGEALRTVMSGRGILETKLQPSLSSTQSTVVLAARAPAEKKDQNVDNIHFSRTVAERENDSEMFGMTVQTSKEIGEKQSTVEETRPAKRMKTEDIVVKNGELGQKQHEREKSLGPIRRQRFSRSKLFRRLVRWHTANLEYGCASDLSSLSLMEWDQDDPDGFRGDHALLRKGYRPIIERLLHEIESNVKYKHKVVEVNNVSQDRVLVGVANQKSNVQYRLFDSAIVSVPLGVLKKNMIDFTPPLPKKKLKAISKLGMGGLMKVALEFEEQFWKDVDVFGALRERAERRGEFYMFWNLARCVGKPILIALVCEPSIQAMESCSDKSIVMGAMKVLRRAYKNASDPIAATVSRWSMDEFARGAYTFIPVGSSGDDYDILAESVGSIFFAGEHTCRCNPGTTGSGVLSGLRAAYDTAMHLGIIPDVVLALEKCGITTGKEAVSEVASRSTKASTTGTASKAGGSVPETIASVFSD